MLEGLEIIPCVCLFHRLKFSNWITHFAKIKFFLILEPRVPKGQIYTITSHIYWYKNGLIKLFFSPSKRIK